MLLSKRVVWMMRFLEHIGGRAQTHLTIRPLVLVIALSVLTLTLAYQWRPGLTIHFDGSENVWLQGFLNPVRGADNSFRWTTDSAVVAVPNPGQAVPLRLRIHLNAWSPDGARTVRVFVNDHALPEFSSGDWRTLDYVVRDRTWLSPERLVLRIETDTFAPRDFDVNSPLEGEVGAAVALIRIDPLFDPAQAFTLPSLVAVSLVSLIVASLFALLEWAGIASRWNGIAAGLVLAAASIGIVFERVNLPLLVGMTVGTATVCLGVAAFWLNRAKLYERTRPVSVLTTIVLVLLLVQVGGWLRLRAMVDQPLDYDEQVYIPAAREYAQAIRAGNWAEFLQVDSVVEHPALGKVGYALALVTNEALGMPLSERTAARFLPTLAGIGLPVLVGLVNPLGGLLLAIHGIEIRYVSEAYLEGFPAMFSAAAIFSYARYRHVKRVRWFFLAAAALGATAASKYVYMIAGAAILPFLIWDHRQRPWRIVWFTLTAVLFFVALNPLLWVDPIGRLGESIRFHLNYQIDKGARSGRAWWFEVGYLFLGNEPGRDWRFSFDTVTFVLGWLGAPFLARQNKLYLTWFALSFLFLLVWPTKWNQYALVFITPMCLSAGAAVSAFWRWMRERYLAGRLLVPEKAT